VAGPNWRRWVGLAIQWGILLLSSLLISGYQLYSNNHAMQIPYVFWLQDPSLFPGDPLVSTFPKYIGPIWHLVAFISEKLSLETTLLVFFLLTRGLIILAPGLVANSIFPGSNLAPTGAMAFFALVPAPIIGHGTLVINYFEHTGLSIAFLILSFGAFYSKRSYWWAILLAAGFNLNILYGTYALVFFLPVLLLDTEYRKKWKKWAASLVILLILCTPILIFSITKIQPDNTYNQLWLKASEVRHPFHIYPHTWNIRQIAVFAGFMLCYCLVLFFSRHKIRDPFKPGLIWLVVCICWIGFTFFSTYILQYPNLLILQPARATDIWFAIAAIQVITVFAYMIEKEKILRRLNTFLFFISVLWLNFFYFPAITVAIWILIAVILAIPITWEFLNKKGGSILISNAAVIFVLAFGIISLSEDFHSYMEKGFVKLPDSEMRKIAGWAKEKTSKEEIFLIDPNWEQFRPLSQRPVFVAWKDGTAIFWDKGFVQEWVRRIEEFGFNFSTAELGTTRGSIQLSEYYQNMDDNQVLKIADQYSIHYWVVKIDKETSFPEVFRVAKYKVLQIQ